MKVSFGLWEVEIPDEQTPMGIAKEWGNTAIATHNDALGRGYEALGREFGREFGKAVGDEVGKGARKVIEESAPTPKNMIAAAGQAQEAGASMMESMWKMSPWGMMSAMMTGAKNDPSP